jgi:asparagine synthase (glutamine-hydrolysing)
MSGICGICEPGREFLGTTLRPMLDSLALRGDKKPDELSGSGAIFGVSSRWSGHQVASIPGVRLCLDSDLVNTHAWDETLSRTGLKLQGMSLAEKVGWLYMLLGLDFLERLEGAFSLALWDEKRRRLVLAIDRMGIHSCYWLLKSNQIIFASRVNAICAACSTPPDVDPAAVMQYLLFTAVPAPLTIYKEIRKLRPGYCIVYDDAGLNESQYWDMTYPEESGRNEENWAKELTCGIRSSVHRYVEDCPGETTGAYLSGGTDSSSVVAFASEKLSPMNAFSIFFAEEKYSEIGYARITANRFGARLYERRISAQDALEAIPRISAYYGEPFANSSAIGTYYCAQLAREQGVETLLAGDGGDEIFAGNDRYGKDRKFSVYGRMPEFLRKLVIEPGISLLPNGKSIASLPKRYVQRANIPNPRRIFSYGPFFSIPPQEIFEADFLAVAPVNTWMQLADANFYRHASASELNRMMYFDLKLILADNDLRKVVGTAELAGVRARFPLLNHRLVELTGRIPSRMKMRGSQKRYIFKKAMRGILPEQVLQKKKHGFGVPLGLWLHQEPSLREMMKEVLHDPQAQQRGYVQRKFLTRLLNLQQSEDPAFYGEAVWTLVALELWHRQHSVATRSACFV